MQLHNLKLLHFRNYDHLEISFHPELNIFFGKNGSGKTNLVEAIYVLSLTKSFRTINDKLLISLNSKVSKVEGDIKSKGNNYNNYRILLSSEGKKVKINKNKVNKLSDYITKIPIILFHPDDLKLVKDTPSTRRKKISISISQYSLEYLKNLSVYNKLLKQRNSYLKSMAVNANHSYDYLNILTEKLVYYGEKVYQERKQFVDNLNMYLDSTYKDIANVSGLKLEYYSDYMNVSHEKLLDNYRKLFKKDLALGKTSYGIHTDDIAFVLDDLDLKEYGSEGQQKNAVIAYKLSELEFLEKKLLSEPILILDDLFSELDVEKIEKIFAKLNSKVQTFITTTELERVDKLIKSSYKSFEISYGNVVEEITHEK